MTNRSHQQCEACKCAHGELHVHANEQTIRYYITERVQAAKKIQPEGGYAEFELPQNSKHGFKVLADMMTAFEVLDETQHGIQYHDPRNGWTPVSVRMSNEETNFRVRYFPAAAQSGGLIAALTGAVFGKFTVG